MLSQIVRDLCDGVDEFVMYQFSLSLFLDAARNGENGIRSMSRRPNRLKIKENEKEKGSCFLIPSQT